MTRLSYIIIVVLSLFIGVLGGLIVHNSRTYQLSGDRGLECVYNCDNYQAMLKSLDCAYNGAIYYNTTEKRIVEFECVGLGGGW